MPQMPPTARSPRTRAGSALPRQSHGVNDMFLFRVPFSVCHIVSHDHLTLLR